jgi:hypothetical protein
MNKLKWLALLLLLVPVVVSADSTASVAVTTLDWSKAKLPSTAVPSTGVGEGGVLAGDASITQAFGYYLPTNTFLYKGIAGDGEQGVIGWNPSFASLEIAPGIFSTATEGTDITTVAASNKDYALFSQADRLGTFTTDGKAKDIVIPYSFSSITCQGCETLNTAWLVIFGADIGTSVTYTDLFGPLTHEQKGKLRLDIDDLPPGTYNFDAGVASQSTFVPEPSSLVLLLVSLGLLVGGITLFRARV